MNDAVRSALETDRVIDITTVGRRTGQPQRKEIWFHNLAGRIFITGSPGRRDWYANLLATPGFTFHLKGSVSGRPAGPSNARQGMRASAGRCWRAYARVWTETSEAWSLW